VDQTTASPVVVFAGGELIARGMLTDIVRAAKARLDTEPNASLQIFDAEDSRPVEVDFRGTAEDVLARLAPSAPATPRSPGRPKLGVVAREVTLLPRHWEWLAAQPGGASATLRKLVENARRDTSGDSARRVAQESAYRFAAAMAGNETGFEEAIRALYAGDAERFEQTIATWPADVRDHARELAASAFGSGGA